MIYFFNDKPRISNSIGECTDFNPKIIKADGHGFAIQFEYEWSGSIGRNYRYRDGLIIEYDSPMLEKAIADEQKEDQDFISLQEKISEFLDIGDQIKQTLLGPLRMTFNEPVAILHIGDQEIPQYGLGAPRIYFWPKDGLASVVILQTEGGGTNCNDTKIYKIIDMRKDEVAKPSEANQ